MNGGHFEFFDSSDAGSGRSRGAVYINDLSNRSDFIFDDWGLPILRPKTLECSSCLDNILNDKGLPVSHQHAFLEELFDEVGKKLINFQKTQQDAYFLIVSFGKKQEENFSLSFSDRAKTYLIEPLERNFLFSKQNFTLVTASTNVLFKKIERSMPNVSCLELRFGESIDIPSEGVYSKERVFEEVVTFANLALLKMI